MGDNVTVSDISAYMDLLDQKNIDNKEDKKSFNKDMDLDEINDRIAILEDFKAVIEDRIVNLEDIRAKRLISVKMLRKVPKKEDKIAC